MSSKVIYFIFLEVDLLFCVIVRARSLPEIIVHRERDRADIST